MQYPYSDEMMKYDFKVHRYILTEKCVFEELNIDMSERIRRGAINKQGMIGNLLNLASQHVYNFIHQHNNTQAVNYIMAKTPTARDVLKEAMKSQLMYLLSVGDLSISVDNEKRKLWFSETAKLALNAVLPETGTTLLYRGGYRFYNLDLSYEAQGY